MQKRIMHTAKNMSRGADPEIKALKVVASTRRVVTTTMMAFTMRPWEKSWIRKAEV